MALPLPARHMERMAKAWKKRRGEATERGRRSAAHATRRDGDECRAGGGLRWGLQGRDLNPRPLGYEPSALPDCATLTEYRSCRFPLRMGTIDEAATVRHHAVHPPFAHIAYDRPGFAEGFGSVRLHVTGIGFFQIIGPPCGNPILRFPMLHGCGRNAQNRGGFANPSKGIYFGGGRCHSRMMCDYRIFCQ